MGSRVLVYGSGALSFSPRFRRIACELDAAGRCQLLKQVDKELGKGNERAALNLVKDLQASGGLRCFGAARQIPQRLYTLDELKLNGIEASSLLSPVDATLGSIERSIQTGAVLGGIAAWNWFGLTPQQIFFTSLGLLFLWTLDALSSSSFFGRSSGTLRRAAVSGSRETFTLGNDSDPTHSRTPEASPATVNKISSGQRTSPFGGSSDPKHASSGRNNSSIKNYDSTIKGIESLHFDDEERFH